MERKEKKEKKSRSVKMAHFSSYFPALSPRNLAGKMGNEFLPFNCGARFNVFFMRLRVLSKAAGDSRTETEGNGGKSRRVESDTDEFGERV